jgi:hypothetical protein
VQENIIKDEVLKISCFFFSDLEEKSRAMSAIEEEKSSIASNLQTNQSIIGEYFLFGQTNEYQYYGGTYQSSFYPSIKHPETNMSRLGFEAPPPTSQAGTLPKSYLDSLHI